MAVPASELPSRCAEHDGVPAVGRCGVCERAVCEGCTTRTPTGGLVCPACVGAGSDRKRRRNRVVNAVVALAGAGGLTAILLQPAPKPHEYTDPAEERPDEATGVTALRKDWGRLPCDAQVNVALGEALLRVNKPRDAIAMVERYEAKCDVQRRVLWVKLSAYKRLEQWAQARVIADRLVAERPTDLNYWWWRAELRAQVGDDAGAAGDYRQSFAREPNGAAATGLEIVRRCQSGFAWTIYALLDEERDWARPSGAAPFERPACRALLGTGGTSVSPDEGGRLLATAAVGGVELRALIDPRAGTSAITPAAAAKVGTTPASGEISTYLGDTTVTGAPQLLREIDVQGARARQLTVVVAGLPEDVDIVLGINFLWRFERHDTEYAMLLAPWNGPAAVRPGAGDPTDAAGVAEDSGGAP